MEKLSDTLIHTKFELLTCANVYLRTRNQTQYTHLTSKINKQTKVIQIETF